MEEIIISQFVNYDVKEAKRPRVKPYGLPYTAMVEKAKKTQRDIAIRRAKINDKEDPKPKGTREKTKTIHLLDY